MKDGFLKAAAFSPALRVADCTYNAQQVLAQLQAAAQRGVKLAVFPEFCLTGYTCGDLFCSAPCSRAHWMHWSGCLRRPAHWTP